MNANATRSQEGIDLSETLDDMAAKIGFVVGVDGENHAHVHYPAVNVVKVFDVSEDYTVGDSLPDNPDRVEQLAERPLEHWMAFVSMRRGWAETTHRAPESWGGEQR